MALLTVDCQSLYNFLAMLNQRSATILEAVIDEFINSGEPVSSGRLFDKYDFRIKPAAIRLELTRLTDGGFLAKAHHSAGRVPTDKGYKFFIGKLRDEKEKSASSSRMAASLAREFFEGSHLDFINKLSANLHLLSIGYDIPEGNVYKKGLEELLGREDWRDADDFVRIARDFEMIDKRFDDLLRGESIFDGPEVFVGSSPLTKSDALSIIIDQLNNGEDSFMVALIGPKRMDYRTNLEFLSAMKKNIETYGKSER